MTTPAKALWLRGAATPELRDTPVDVKDGEVTVRMLYSGISRGTERLVFHGRVPPTEHDTMRAPFQDGAFSFPVKYGYAAVGLIETGPRAGETVFVLHPHQNRFAVPSDAAHSVPATVPPQRAILAANMETALNILWDARVGPGDRVVVIGAGVVGALVGYLCAQIPGAEVCLVDIDAEKAGLAATLGCTFALPQDAPKDADVVIHASATSAGLATAISAAGVEATLVEASWYGAQDTQVPLGGPFHQRRLQIVSSQVGRIPAHQAARWTYQRRLGKALSLLADPALDALISGETAFASLPDDYAAILDDPGTLCYRIAYDPS